MSFPCTNQIEEPPTKSLSHFLKFPYTYVLLQTLHVLVGAFDSFIYDVISMIFRYASSSVDVSLAWYAGLDFFFTIFFPLVLALGAICFPPSCLFVSAYTEIVIIEVCFVIFIKFLIFRNISFALAIMISIVHIHALHAQIGVTSSFSVVSSSEGISLKACNKSSDLNHFAITYTEEDNASIKCEGRRCHTDFATYRNIARGRARCIKYNTLLGQVCHSWLHTDRVAYVHAGVCGDSGGWSWGIRNGRGLSTRQCLN